MADSSLRTIRERVMRKSQRIVVSVLFLYWAVGLALPARNWAAEPASTSSSAWESLPAGDEKPGTGSHRRRPRRRARMDLRRLPRHVGDDRRRPVRAALCGDQAAASAVQCRAARLVGGVKVGQRDVHGLARREAHRPGGRRSRQTASVTVTRSHPNNADRRELWQLCECPHCETSGRLRTNPGVQPGQRAGRLSASRSESRRTNRLVVSHLEHLSTPAGRLPIASCCWKHRPARASWPSTCTA